MAGNVLNISDVAGFEKALRIHPTGAIHFWAPWSEPCKHMDAVFAQLASDNPQAAFLRVEAEEVPDVSETCRVAFVPHFTFFKAGELVDKLEGADAAQLSAKVDQHIKLGAPMASQPPAASRPAAGLAASLASADASRPDPTSNGAAAPSISTAGKGPALQQRLEQLTHAAPIMLFMKGTREQPRCGFSARVVQAIQEAGVPFQTFDILSDEAVRQGLKEYSDWPTYPQLYVDGELLGGSDIIEEMQDSGELASTLQATVKAAGPIASATASTPAPANGSAPAASANGHGQAGSLQQRLEQLVHREPVMLFMKGTPEGPRCGFSAKVVKSLRDIKQPFGSFDILSDEAVRQGLKEFSQWPTYPQLYVGGELMGGCDIILEMAQTGELQSSIKEMLP